MFTTRVSLHAILRKLCFLDQPSCLFFFVSSMIHHINLSEFESGFLFYAKKDFEDGLFQIELLCDYVFVPYKFRFSLDPSSLVVSSMDHLHGS